MEAYRFFCYCIVYAFKFVSCLILLLNIFVIVLQKMKFRWIYCVFYVIMIESSPNTQSQISNILY